MQHKYTTFGSPLNGKLYNYYYLGRGAQFRVYGITTLDGKPTDRVIKVPLDYAETYQEILEPLRLLAKHNSNDHLLELAHNRVVEVMQFKHSLPNIVQGIMGRDLNFTRRLGNLKVLQTPIPATNDSGQTLYYLPIFFTQDYVMTLDQYLQHFRLATISYTRDLDIQNIKILKEVIDQMIKLNYMIWEYGIFEFVFKPENLGIRPNHDGTTELIWMDLAEHITDLDEAVEIIKQKRWHHPLMPHKVDYQFLPTVLHDYYVKTMDAAYSEEVLRKLWRRKCLRAEERASKRLRVKEMLTRNEKRSVGYWVARHNLSNSLYRGFPDHTIDDMEIPADDLKLLLEDKYKPSISVPHYQQERIERDWSAAQKNDNFLFPSVQNVKKAGS